MIKSLKCKINFRFIPIVLIFSVLPLIVYNYVFPEPIYKDYAWYYSGKTATDTFLHYKSVFFAVLSLFIILGAVEGFLKLEKTDKRKKLILFSPLIVYMLCIIISTIFSLDKNLSLHGAYDQQEPLIVLLGYSLLSLYVLLYFKDLKDLKILFIVLSISVMIMTVIGILQFFDYNIFSKDWIKYFILPKELRDNVILSDTKKGVFSTLGNQNYIGTYTAMLLPFVIGLGVVFKERLTRTLAVIDLLCLAFLLFGSGSATGMIAVMMISLVALLFLGKKIVSKWYLSLPIILTLIVSVFVIDHFRDGYFINKIKESVFSDKAEYDLTEIDTSGNRIRFIYKGKEICIKIGHNEKGVQAEVTEDGEPREIVYDLNAMTNVFFLSSGESIPFQVMIPSDNEVTVELWPVSMDSFSNYVFKYNSDTENYTFRNWSGVYDESIKWENVLAGRENIASGRGYIWGVTIPMLKEYILIGSGPDTFPVALGRHGSDYALKINAGVFGILFNRPHNYFLQMGIDTGVISLLACTIFWIMYFVDCIKLYFWKELDTANKKVGFVCMLSSLGFLVCGLGNDSLVCVTPIFWCILGMGLTLNIRQKEDNSNVRSIKARIKKI